MGLASVPQAYRCTHRTHDEQYGSNEWCTAPPLSPSPSPSSPLLPCTRRCGPARGNRAVWGQQQTQCSSCSMANNHATQRIIDLQPPGSWTIHAQMRRPGSHAESCGGGGGGGGAAERFPAREGELGVPDEAEPDETGTEPEPDEAESAGGRWGSCACGNAWACEEGWWCGACRWVGEGMWGRERE